MDVQKSRNPVFMFRCVSPSWASRCDKLSDMAPVTTTRGKRGPLPKGGERRVAVQTKLPESLVEDLFGYVRGNLGMARSDFLAYASIVVANELRTKDGLEPVRMPDYIVEAVEGAKNNDNPLQEALLEAS